jgi:UDP-N-acetylglucosamine 1-carboxyvinyltransferase
MTAATLARGRSVLRGAAKEPEVIELGRFLNAAGAQISGLGTDTLEIDGVEELRPVAHRVTTDRVEAATFAVAALITGGDITIRNAPVEHMTAVIQALRDIGGDADDTAFGLRIRRTGELRCVRLRAEPHPGIPTDVQSQLTALLATVPGESHVIDQVFPQRFQHVPELNRLGASIRVNGNGAAIQGVSSLSGAPVQASDLRAGAALVLAALAAEGESIIHGADHIDRGYSAFDRKLRALGAAIERLAGPSAAEPLAPWVPAPHFAGGSEADSLELNYGFRAYGADPA